MEEHYATEMHNEDQVAQLDIADDGDLEASRQIIRQMYANREAFLLLLTKSQGSRFENCLDEVVDISLNSSFDILKIIIFFQNLFEYRIVY